MRKFDLAAKAHAYADHWNNAETALGRAIVLPEGTTQSGFTDSSLAAKAAQDTVIARTNDMESAMQTRDSTLGPLQSSASLFTAYVRASTPGSTFVKMLPKIPATTAAAVKWGKVLQDLDGIWTRLDTANPADYPALSLPTRLSNGTTRAQFSPDVAQFGTALNDLQEAINDIKEAQGDLRNLGKSIRADISAYRKLIRSLFPTGHPIRTTLP
ncbi:hypothetical protein [Armatimonas sp.]|uniref:hypothetical protein n=1 Tax=Armatimonas sp. TaxID=1872638 RepID=UPI00286BA502|nr:hypothetical protein [Armatimonas sp.]